MPLPTITNEDVAEIVPDAAEIAIIGRGGQKLVFRIKRANSDFVLKFAALTHELQTDAGDFDGVVIRAQRETEIMEECDSPFLVKNGPVPLGTTTVRSGELVIYFSEELVEGAPLNECLRSRGPLNIEDLIQLGLDISSAIETLWTHHKIHRDIKPRNIMMKPDRRFVLLDAGLAFDTHGMSLSEGFLVGTMAYFSPEQFDYTTRRTLDFRSDLFSLGVTLYEAATGRHPFYDPATSTPHLFSRITTETPAPPSTLNAALPVAFDEVLAMMLGKSPHLRYRRISQLREELEQLRGG